MKKLIFLFLLIPALCFGDMNPYIAGIVVASSGDYGARADTVDTDYGTITDHNDLDMVNNFTIEFWMYYDGTGNPVDYAQIVSHWPAWFITFTTGGLIRGGVEISSSPSDTATTTSFSSLSTAYHHIAFVKSSTDGISIYLNGTRESTSSGVTGDIDTTANNVGILRYLGDTGYGCKFRIDELRISDTARYSGTTLTVPSASFSSDGDTVALYLFNEGSGGAFEDETGTHDGTWSGTMTLNEDGKW